MEGTCGDIVRSSRAGVADGRRRRGRRRRRRADAATHAETHRQGGRPWLDCGAPARGTDPRRRSLRRPPPGPARARPVSRRYPSPVDARPAHRRAATDAPRARPRGSGSGRGPDDEPRAAKRPDPFAGGCDACDPVARDQARTPARSRRVPRARVDRELLPRPPGSRRRRDARRRRGRHLRGPRVPEGGTRRTPANRDRRVGTDVRVCRA